jgi:hypothetical protein
MCVCCPPLCWAACFVQSAARRVGEPRSAAEIARQRERRERKGLGAGAKWGVNGVNKGDIGELPLPSVSPHQPGALAAHARDESESGGAGAATPAAVEMPERRQGAGGSAENRL